MTLHPQDPSADEALIASVRDILLAHDRDRIRQVESLLEIVKRASLAQDDVLQDQIRALEAELLLLRDPERLTERLAPVMALTVRRTIRESPDDMAEALGPVMGNAIRAQIRAARSDMVEALYPIIGETVQRAIAEFAREFQRNIDARLRIMFGPQGWFHTLTARLQGISPAELALRGALPFSLREIFIIQRDSGLLLAHSHPGRAESMDSDLISGMLTAIRDFTRDSFGHHPSSGDELDEIQYGDQRIILQGGRAAYVAVVMTGIEPEGFRARLHEFVSELHIRHDQALRAYTGNSADLPNLQSPLEQFVAETDETARAKPRPLSRNQKLAIGAGGLMGLLLVGLACFYLQFTLALLPMAFPGVTATATATLMPSPTHTRTATIIAATITATPTVTPTSTITASPTSSSTATATATHSRTPTASPTATEVPLTAVTNGNVWLRTQPSATAGSRIVPISKNIPVEVVAVYGEWIEIQYLGSDGPQRGWVPLRWVSLSGPIPLDRITPTVLP